MMEKIVEEIGLRPGLARVVIKGVVDEPGVASRVFSLLGEVGFNLEVIAQTGVGRKRADISFALSETEAPSAVELLNKRAKELGARDVSWESGLALVTVYGRGLATTPGLAGKVFSCLAERGINIELISASLTMLGLLIKQERAEEARTLIGSLFE
jgi:aspartate kinase